MSTMRALDIVDGETPAEQSEAVEAWQHLIDTGEAWTLPGRYGRTAMALIDSGLCTSKEVEGSA